MADQDEEVKAYEEGKGRRYQLLFAVNGGAFAIISLWVDATGDAAAGADLGQKPIFGALLGWQVGVGMALFNAVMFADICAFGWGKRSATIQKVFHPVGVVVLICIAALLVSGWILAMSVIPLCAPWIIVVVLVVLGVLARATWMENERVNDQKSSGSAN